MRPLHVSQIEVFNKRFNNLIDAELIRVDINSATAITLIFNVQDENREFDWIGLELQVSGVSDAKIVDDNKIPFIDMSDGVSILHENSSVIISIGKYRSFETANNAPLFVKGSTLKYKENTFNA